MAEAAVAPDLFSEQELTCSICLDLFDEPVSTPCGHNFCQVTPQLPTRGGHLCLGHVTLAEAQSELWRQRPCKRPYVSMKWSSSTFAPFPELQGSKTENKHLK